MSDQYQPPRGASGDPRNDESGRPYDPARGQAAGSGGDGQAYRPQSASQRGAGGDGERYRPAAGADRGGEAAPGSYDADGSRQAYTGQPHFDEDAGGPYVPGNAAGQGYGGADRPYQAPGGGAGDPYAGQPYQPYGAPSSSGAPAGQYPGYGQPAGQPYGEPYPGQPPYGQAGGPGYAAPYAGQPPYGQPGYPQPAGGVPPQLPSRAWPITLVSLGAVMMLLIAPIVFMVMAGQALSQTEFFSDLTKSTVSNPIQNRTYNKDDTIMAIVQPRDGAWRCVATDPKGGTFQLHQVSEEDHELGSASERAYVASGDAKMSGRYQVQCISGNNTHLQGMVLVSPDALRGAIGSFGVAFLVGSGIGFAGLVVLIVGIVWLVRANRRRRQALAHSSLF